MDSVPDPMPAIELPSVQEDSKPPTIGENYRKDQQMMKPKADVLLAMGDSSTQTTLEPVHASSQGPGDVEDKAGNGENQDAQKGDDEGGKSLSPLHVPCNDSMRSKLSPAESMEITKGNDKGVRNTEPQSSSAIFSISGRNDQPIDVGVSGSLIEEQEDPDQVRYASADKAKMREIDTGTARTPDQDLPCLVADVRQDRNVDLTSDFNPSMQSDSNERSASTTDHTNGTNESVQPRENVMSDEAVGQESLEPVEPFRSPPELPDNRENFPTRLDYWMQAIDKFLRINQENLEKLRMKCQACHCNSAEPAKPTIASLDQGWEVQASASAVKENLAAESSNWETTEEASSDRKANKASPGSNFDKEHEQRAIHQSAMTATNIQSIEYVLPLVRKLRHQRLDEETELAAAVRYWEVLSRRSIEDDGSFNAVEAWFAKARPPIEATEINDDIPSPLDSNEDAVRGRQLGASSQSQSQPTPEQMRELRAARIQARIDAESARVKKSEKFKKRYPPPQESSPPRNKTVPKKFLPDSSPSNPSSSKNTSLEGSSTTLGQSLTQSESSTIPMSNDEETAHRAIRNADNHDESKNSDSDACREDNNPHGVNNDEGGK